ncbi:uncharacterized protein LAESUDRAFT_723155 [Laetiporus sulphureus 93-53]|uniref:Uncharacterized protein n=1 Tax=Laetiporus sulphureus 93-53 TaxID=1314785 RepID=A0A165FTL7_9APHY|nr:uncharacterized protein LAESUDRAFT_723155 [Laetiporus sulphureus 93-53]KZT09394.1 hypothetical protein LAESUDRAFT_723155 [Laetiporus sulphureus 93-53]
MPPTASSIISDALNSLSKAANLALATVEEQARSDVTRANAEAVEARRERDDAVKVLHILKQERREWERRAEALQAAIDKAELTIKHQAESTKQQTESIQHLRAEAHQWKTQFIKLEESSRLEIADWKEQCLRAEQDRCRLSSRIDELVAEQLAWNTQANVARALTTPLTPYPEYDDHSSVSSISTKRASASSHPYGASQRKHTTPRIRASEIEELRPVRDSRGSLASKHSQQRISEQSPSRSTIVHNTSRTRTSVASPTEAPQQRVIRRVHAVITVPVKEEDDSEANAEILESDASGSAYEPEEEQPVKRRQHERVSDVGRPRQRQRYVEPDEDEDEEQDDGSHRRHNRFMHEQTDDDVDELAMTAEDSQIYAATIHTSSPQKSPQKARRPTAPRPSGAKSAKKRKLDTGTAATAKGSRRR